MRIAQIAPPWYPVPPSGYGGIELVVALLADGLQSEGHDVTLFASGGSVSAAKIVSPLEDPPDPALLGNVWFDAFHALSAYLDAGDFDVIHDHSGIVGPALGALLSVAGVPRPPIVHTLHGPWTEPARRYYELIADHVHLVSISNSQRDDHPELRYAATVYNGIDLRGYPLVEDKDPFLVYIGRANPDKGPDLAVEIAKRAGLPLAMIVKKNEPAEQVYWSEVVAPQLTDEVEVLEHVSHDVKVDLLGRAQALVFPIRWSEPFGLVMVEAMACGTPVVTSPFGAAVELVEEGVTGFLHESLEDLVAAVGEVGGCDPRACRERVAQQFSAEAMVRGYEALFERVIAASGRPT